MTDEREVDRYDIALDVIDAAIDELKPEAKRLALWAWTGIRKLLPEPSPDSVAIIAARLAQADAGAAVPEGWQLVPIEPVDAQFEAAIRLQGEDAAIAAAIASAPALLSALLKIYRAMIAAAPQPAAQQPAGDGGVDALAILDRLVTVWTAQAKDCRDMAERLPNHTPHNELLRDASQYDQSIYGVGLAIAALRANAGDTK